MARPAPAPLATRSCRRSGRGIGRESGQCIGRELLRFSILADLLAAETGMPDARLSKPCGEPGQSSETGRLRATVGQLEHALLTRIRVEQAIGVLAERHRIKPRQAFEQLREAARNRGRKVIDIAGDVVASATNPLLQLPDELSRPRSGPRRPARQQFGAQ